MYPSKVQLEKMANQDWTVGDASPSPRSVLRIGSVSTVVQFLDSAHNGKERLFGSGHAPDEGCELRSTLKPLSNRILRFASTKARNHLIHMAVVREYVEDD